MACGAEEQVESNVKVLLELASVRAEFSNTYAFPFFVFCGFSRLVSHRATEVFPFVLTYHIWQLGICRHARNLRLCMKSSKTYDCFHAIASFVYYNLL